MGMAVERNEKLLHEAQKQHQSQASQGIMLKHFHLQSETQR